MYFEAGETGSDLRFRRGGVPQVVPPPVQMLNGADGVMDGARALSIDPRAPGVRRRENVTVCSVHTFFYFNVPRKCPARLLMLRFSTTPESFEHSPGRWKTATFCVIGPNHRWVQVWLPSSNGLEARLLPKVCPHLRPSPVSSAALRVAQSPVIQTGCRAACREQTAAEVLEARKALLLFLSVRRVVYEKAPSGPYPFLLKLVTRAAVPVQLWDELGVAVMPSRMIMR